MTMTKTAPQAINIVSEGAIPRQEKRVLSHKHIPVQKYIRQGDLYVINVTGLKKITVFKDKDGKNGIEVNLTEYITKVKSNKRVHQLVPGSTVGSHHQVLADKVDMYINPTNRSSVIGPVLKAEQAFDVLHPHHAHHNLPGNEYLVCYQLNDKTKERVKD